MQKTVDEQEILVRGSEQHKDYLRYQFGRIKDAVNSFETRIAVSGRAMLLIYVVYITVKAGVGNSLPKDMPAGVNVALVLLDITMLALQVLGLEGSVPGLRHLAEDLESKGNTREAKTVRAASNIAQWLLAATAIDIVLQRNAGAWGITDFANGYTNGLFVLRVIVIGLYLVAMAKLEHKGPKVISAHEAAKKAEEEEQKQIRIDNANIMGAVNRAIAEWAKKQPDVNTAFSESMHRLESIVSQKIESTQQAQNERIESTHRLVEALQFGSSPASLESILSQVESIVKQQVSQIESTLSQRIESTQREVKRQANRPESTPQVKATAPVEKKTVERKAATQERSSNVSSMDRWLSKDEVLRLIEADESLLNLSDSDLGKKVGATKSTANRAKKDWSLSRSESTQVSDSTEREAVNL